VMTGSAAHIAARNLRAKALEAGAELMQAPAATLDLVDGRVIRRDMPHGPSMRLAEIVQNSPAGLSAVGRYTTEHMNYPYGVHVAVVRVDREIGGVAIERYLTAYDIGRAINPMLIEGQIAGGFAQGLGGALLEEFTYDERGEPLSVTFADYLMPTAHDVPPLDVILPKTRRARSTRSASKVRAKPGSTASAPRSPLQSTRQLASPALVPDFPSPSSGCGRFWPPAARRANLQA
jgi:aerobic carbon-monoxide dehydrogenase large subunit